MFFLFAHPEFQVSMASPHFLLFPFMAQGHMPPMIDLAKLLARRGVIITIVTTPHNAARNHSILSRAIHSGLQINVVQLPFPCLQGGLPEGCENLDLLPSLDLASKFLRATFFLLDPSAELFQKLTPRPTCIISDPCLPWTIKLAHKFHIPRIVFYSLCCFSLLCQPTLVNKEPLLRSLPDQALVTVPDLPGYDFQFRRSTLPKHTDQYFAAFNREMEEADLKSYSIIINSFEELEPKNLAEYRKLRDLPEKVWCIGPVSLCNHDKLDKAERGNKSAIDQHECLKWMDWQPPSSVVYVSLGSICNLTTRQLIELGLGLEASKRPFIWVIRKGNETKELQKWMEAYNFKEKTKGRGLVIRGWAPQVMILSHTAIGSFLTHCGWNSTLEGISAGVPMITWPLFSDQFNNEVLIVKMLKNGVSVGVEASLQWGEEEEIEVAVKKEDVMKAIERVMSGTKEGEEIRERCKELGKKANRAVEEGGSSHHNIKLFIDDLIDLAGGDPN